MWHACVFVCALVGVGWGGTNYNEREGKKKMEGKGAFGAPCPALAWFLRVPRGHRGAIFSAPPFFLLTVGESPRTHTRAYYVTPDILHAVIQQNAVRYSRKRHCVLSGCHKRFPDLYSRTQRQRFGAAASSGCGRPGKLAAF